MTATVTLCLPISSRKKLVPTSCSVTSNFLDLKPSTLHSSSINYNTSTNFNNLTIKTTTMSATINEDAVKSVSNQEGQIGSHVPPSEPLEKGGVSHSPPTITSLT